MSRNTVAVLFIFVAVLAVAPFFAHAARTIVVAADGSGDFKTIKEAHDEAKKGDTIMLRGAGPGGIWEFKPNSGLNYAGDGISKAKIEMENVRGVKISEFMLERITISKSKEVTVEESAIRATNSYRTDFRDKDNSYSRGVIVIEDSENVTVKKCRVSNGDGSAIYLTGSDMVRIDSNVLYDNWGGGVRVQEAFGKDKSRVEIVNNTIIHNQFKQPGFDLKKYVDEKKDFWERQMQRDGSWQQGFTAEATVLRFQHAGEARAISFFYNNRVIVEGNIIVGNDVGLLGDWRTGVNKDDVLAGAAVIRQTCESRPSPKIRHNLIYGNSKMNYAHSCNTYDVIKVEEIAIETLAKEKNISVDPGFMDPEKNDFRLKPDSPALQAGPKGGSLGAPREVLVKILPSGWWQEELKRRSGGSQ